MFTLLMLGLLLVASGGINTVLPLAKQYCFYDNYAVLEQEMGMAGKTFRLIHIMTQDVMSRDQEGLQANASFRIILQILIISDHCP